MDTSKDIRERIREVADDFMVAGVGGEFLSEEGIDSILEIFKEYIHEKKPDYNYPSHVSVHNHMKGYRVAVDQYESNLIEGLKNENKI